MTEKTKSQTYNFLLENKTIEDIKKQENINIKEIKNNRHGGKTYRIDNANNHKLNNNLFENIDENLKPTVTVSLTDNEKIQENNIDIWTKFKNFLTTSISNTEETSRLQSIIQEKDKNIKQLKKENEELNKKQSNVNFDKFKYNALTIYNEKQKKDKGIEKIHEEILSINNEIYYIITFVHINNSISEKILYFDYYKNNDDLQVINQTKKYQNINEYNNDFSLFEDTLINKNNLVFSKMTIKAFLKQQQDFKLKPTKIEKNLWYIFTVVTLLTVTSTLLLLVPPIASISAIAIAIKTTAGFIGGIRIFASLFSSATRKVDVWFGNKLYKNKEQKEKEKKERQSIIKNLSTDKLETKLQTQYDILKQELDNKKDMKPDELISNSTINHNSNSTIQNSIIESENNQNFDSSIRNKVNHQHQHSTISKNNWNKVKCLLTT